MLDTAVRLLVILALISYGVYRIVRYFRYGMAKRVTAIPPAAGMFPQETVSATNPLMSSPPSAVSTWLVGIRTLALWVGANLLLAAVLFAIPALSAVPVIWRLFAQIFANFYLLPWARKVAARTTGS
jgi:hypothetical protein